MNLPRRITVPMSSILVNSIVMIVIIVVVVLIIILLNSVSNAGVVLVAGLWDSLWERIIACAIVGTRIGIMIPHRIIIMRLSSWMFRM